MITVLSVFCLLLYGVIMGHLARRILGWARALPGATAARRGPLPGGGCAGGGRLAYGRLTAISGQRASAAPGARRAAWTMLSRQMWKRRCEASCALAFLAAFAALPAERLVSGLVFSWFLLTLSWIDYHTLLLPDRLTLPFLLCGLLSPLGEPQSLYVGLLGALCGGGGLWLLNGVFYRVRGYAGLGGGDIKLLSGLGAWLGWQALPLLCASAALTGIAWWLRRRTADKDIPFGPCLALAGWWIYIGP
ncbi:prepilin peptidase [Sodalis sp. RH24]|uniref:prepilin peptidase n=1 Tax=unclassified Sodalis (in: enterobacteria) TaxID=2636512 RepID=UPI0039B6BC10